MQKNLHKITQNMVSHFRMGNCLLVFPTACSFWLPSISQPMAESLSRFSLLLTFPCLLHRAASVASLDSHSPADEQCLLASKNFAGCTVPFPTSHHYRQQIVVGCLHLDTRCPPKPLHHCPLQLDRGQEIQQKASGLRQRQGEITHPLPSQAKQT